MRLGCGRKRESMNAKLIRIDKSEYNFPIYYFECAGCGKEYFGYNYTKRSTCYCRDCGLKQQREKSKIYRQRKQQEHINEVLDKIRAEIAENGNSDINAQTVLAVIDKYRGIQNE